jgi:hypothetical protein
MIKAIFGILAVTTALTAQPAFAAARVAVLHLAPFASDIEDTAVDIQINGTVTFEGVKYKDFVNYVELDAGDYLIEIIPVGAADPALSETFSLMDGVDYSVMAIGNGLTQDLELTALVDDNTAPMMGNVAVRVAHTAPFASDLAATEVSVRTDGGDVVNGLVGVPYRVNSGFFEVPAGTYNLKIASNDGSVNYIDPDAAALPEGANVTLYAIGDGRNQPLGVLAFPVGELMTSTPVNNQSNGMWEIIEGSGTGFVFQPMPSQNRVVGTWYTYDMGAPIFLTFDSCLEQTNEMGEFECSTPGAFNGVTATTSLYLSTGGGSAEDAVVTTEKVGEIDFEVLGCEDAIAMVRMDGKPAEMYTAKQLTRPFPCVDEL